MKKTAIILLLLTGLFSTLSAQSEKEVFTQPEVVWYGLDFSKAKLVGSDGFSNPQDIQTRFFDSWNQLVVIESEKYNLKKAYNKDNVIYDLTLVEKRNAKVDAKELVINKDYSFEKEEVQRIIGDYQPEQKKGLGLVYVVESFNKLKESATIYVTFFDIATKKVLLTEKMTGKARGFGVRNFWAGAVYDILKESENGYKKWAKKAS